MYYEERQLIQKLQFIQQDKYRRKIRGQDYHPPTHKNKKYLLEQEKNTQIERKNLMLYDQMKIIKDRSISNKSKHKSRARTIKIKTLNTQTTSQVLFKGKHFIDGVYFKVKITYGSDGYRLQGFNDHTSILLQMSKEQYKKFNNNQLKDDPSKVFSYIQITKQGLRIKGYYNSNIEDKKRSLPHLKNYLKQDNQHCLQKQLYLPSIDKKKGLKDH